MKGFSGPFKYGFVFNVFEFNMDLLEYSKLILGRVSFCPELFKKELDKSIDVLEPQEAISLRNWCIREFGKEFPDIMVSTFQTIPNQQMNVLNRTKSTHEKFRN